MMAKTDKTVQTFSVFTEEEAIGFLKLFKGLALSLSDFISSELKVNFSLLDIEYINETYTDILTKMPNNCTYYQLKWFEKYAIMLADNDLIIRLSNCMLGGEGIIEEREEGTFFFSEEMLKDELALWVTRYFNKIHSRVEVERTESDINLVHVFYPDDNLFTYGLKQH